MNGAEADTIPDMLKNIDELLQLAKQLNRCDEDLEKFAQECKTYYRAWQNYLHGSNEGQLTFRQYLELHKISY